MKKIFVAVIVVASLTAHSRLTRFQAATLHNIQPLAIVNFPGQATHPVGHTAAPSYPGFLTPWPPGRLFVSGTPGAPNIYAFYDFDAGTEGTLIGSELHDILFVGDRFQSNSVANYNVSSAGINIDFEYCSFTPRVAIVAAVPHASWPAASARLQQHGNGTGYQISGNDGYQYGLSIIGGPLTVRHSDFWGFGNGGPVFNSSTTTKTIIDSNWIHDAADAASQDYHQDGLGYFNGKAAPQNIMVSNNTIASIGNANAIGFQAATSPYQNVTITGNYLSGFGYTAALFLPGTGGASNSTFTNNILATDIPWIWGPIYGNPTRMFTTAGMVWSGNKIHVVTGTSPLSTSGVQFAAFDDGKFIRPNGRLTATDW